MYFYKLYVNNIVKNIFMFWKDNIKKTTPYYFITLADAQKQTRFLSYFGMGRGKNVAHNFTGNNPLIEKRQYQNTNT